MPTVDYTIVRPGIKYGSHPHHRDGNHNKSQWRITVAQEEVTFTRSIDAKWLGEREGWGLHIVNKAVDYLGVAQDHYTQLFLAKFVDGAGTSEWHGYPANHVQHVQDIPDAKLLREWLEKNTLPRRKIRKLAKGQPCDL